MKLFRFLTLALACAAFAPAAALASAPGAATSAATDVSASSATLNGVVNPNKETTTYHFEYGTTTSYGTVTPNDTAGGNAGKSVSAAITGLTPNTTYHFRLVATNPSGSDSGSDLTFTTTSSPYTLPASVSIAAQPAKITFGGASTISGTVTGSKVAGVVVTLQESPSPFTAPFKNTGATATTDASGHYSFTVNPALNTRYQVVAKTSPPVTSSVVGVFVRYRVGFAVSAKRVHRGQRVRFRGTVAPAADGRRVAIQRKTSRGFRTVARVVLRHTTSGLKSTYAKRLRITRKGTYRVRIAGDSAHLAGTSRTRTIRIA